MMRRWSPPRRVTYAQGLWPISSIDLGSVVTLTHFDALNFSGTKVRAEAIEVDLNAKSVRTFGTDIDDFAGILEGSAGTYYARTGYNDSETLISIILATTVGQQALGGSRQFGDRSASWTDAYEWRDVRIDWDHVPLAATVYADVERRTRNAATSVTARIYNETDASADVTGAPSVDTAWAAETLTIPRPAASGIKFYRLQWVGQNATNDVLVVWSRLRVVA